MVIRSMSAIRQSAKKSGCAGLMHLNESTPGEKPLRTSLERLLPIKSFDVFPSDKEPFAMDDRSPRAVIALWPNVSWVSGMSRE